LDGRAFVVDGTQARNKLWPLLRSKYSDPADLKEQMFYGDSMLFLDLVISSFPSSLYDTYA